MEKFVTLYRKKDREEMKVLKSRICEAIKRIDHYQFKTETGWTISDMDETSEKLYNSLKAFKA